MITIIDYIFGGDDDYDSEDYFGRDYSDVQRSPNEISADLPPQELLYRRRNKNRNKSRYELRSKTGPSKSSSKNRGVVTKQTTSHAGHKRIKSETPCLPEKQALCLNVNASLRLSGEDGVRCDKAYDFCVDDCDCPGFQKCCVNSCGRRECLPSLPKARPASPAPEATSEPTPLTKTAESVEATSNLPPTVIEPETTSDASPSSSESPAHAF